MLCIVYMKPKMTWNSNRAHLTPPLSNHLVSDGSSTHCALVGMPPVIPQVIKYMYVLLLPWYSKILLTPLYKSPLCRFSSTCPSHLLLWSSTANLGFRLVTRCMTKMFLPRWSDGMQLLVHDRSYLLLMNTAPCIPLVFPSVQSYSN